MESQESWLKSLEALNNIQLNESFGLTSWQQKKAEKIVSSSQRTVIKSLSVDALYTSESRLELQLDQDLKQELQLLAVTSTQPRSKPVTEVRTINQKITNTPKEVTIDFIFIIDYISLERDSHTG
jgi:hypothetical protein